MEEPNSRSTNEIYSVLIADYNIKRLAYVYMNVRQTCPVNSLMCMMIKNYTLYRGQLVHYF